MLMFLMCSDVLTGMFTFYSNLYRENELEGVEQVRMIKDGDWNVLKWEMEGRLRGNDECIKVDERRTD